MPTPTSNSAGKLLEVEHMLERQGGYSGLLQLKSSKNPNIEFTGQFSWHYISILLPQAAFFTKHGKFCWEIQSLSTDVCSEVGGIQLKAKLL